MQSIELPDGWVLASEDSDTDTMVPDGWVLATPDTDEPDLQIIDPLQEGVKDIAKSGLGMVRMGTDLYQDKIGGSFSDTLQRGLDKVQNAKILQPDPGYKRSDGWRGYTEDVVRMAPQVAAQTGIALSPAGAVGSMAFMGSQIAGGQYNELRGKDIPVARAIEASLANAAMQAPLEAISLGKALKVWRPTKKAIDVVKHMTEAAGTEWLTEAVQKYPELATNIWAKSQNVPVGNQINQFIDSFAQATKEGLYEGAVAAPFGAIIGGGAAVMKPSIETVDPAAALKTGDDASLDAVLDKTINQDAAPEPFQNIQNQTKDLPEQESDQFEAFLNDEIRYKTPITPKQREVPFNPPNLRDDYESNSKRVKVKPIEIPRPKVRTESTLKPDEPVLTEQPMVGEGEGLDIREQLTAEDVNKRRGGLNQAAQGIADKRNQLEGVEQADTGTEDVNEYSYHVTNKEALNNIIESGLKKGSHLSSNEETADKWKLIKGDVVLRVKGLVGEGTYENSRKLLETVDPKNIEVKKNGEWKPLHRKTKSIQMPTWFKLGEEINFTYRDPSGKSSPLKPNKKLLKDTADKLGISITDAERALSVYNSGDPSYDEKLYQDKKIPTIFKKTNPTDHKIEASESEFQQKLDMMQSEVNNSQTKGVNQEPVNQQGETIAYPANSPKWMQDLQKDLKSAGMRLLSRKDINVLINKKRDGKPLTEKQADQYVFLERAIENYTGDLGEFVSQDEGADLEKKGFDPLGGQKVTVANLNEGDKFVGTVDGVKDEFEVKDTNENGETLLQDGISKRVDMFDDVTIDGIKRKESIEQIPKNDIIEEKQSQYKGTLFNANPKQEKQLELFPVSRDGKILENDAGEGSETDQGGIKQDSKRRLGTKIRTGVRTTGNILHNKLAVTSDQDAASLLSHLSDLPNESLYTVAVDKNGRVIEVHYYSKGSQGSSTVNPSEVTGHVFRQKDTAKVYVVHNHPAGSTESSAADRYLAENLEKLFRLRNLPVSNIIIGRDIKNKPRWGRFKSFGDVAINMRVPDTIKKVSIPVKERIITKNKRDTSITPGTIDKYLDGKPSGFILTDAKLSEVGYLEFSPGMSEKEITAEVLSAMDETNAVMVLPYNKDGANEDRNTFFRKLVEALKSVGKDTQVMFKRVNGKIETTVVEEDAIGDIFDVDSDKPVFQTKDFTESEEPVKLTGKQKLKAAFQKAKDKKNADLQSRKSKVRNGRTTTESRFQRAVAAVGDSGKAKIVKPFTKKQKALAKIGKAFGTQIVLFRSTDPDINDLSGFTYRSDNQIFINLSYKGHSPIATLGHEIMHQIASRHPDIYKTLTDAFKDNKKDYFLWNAKFKVGRELLGLDSLSEEAIEEEFIGDFATDQWQRAEFWEKLNEKSPGITDKLFNIINKIINKIKSVLTRTEQHILDIDKAQNDLVSAMSEAMRRTPNAETTSDQSFLAQTQQVASEFYSALQNAVESIKQKVMPGKMWAALISSNKFKQSGVKQEEIEWSGLKDWLADQNGKVTKQEVLDHLAANKVEIEEVVHKTLSKKGKDRITELQLEQNKLQSDYNAMMKDGIDVDAADNINDRLDEIREELNNLDDTTKYANSSYTTPGLEDYKEIVLWSEAAEPMSSDPTHFVEGHEGKRQIAWIRMGTKYVDGKKVLVVDEIQSKRHQEGRKKGYTNQTEIDRLEKRHLKLHSEVFKKGFDPLALLTGKIKDPRVKEMQDISLEINRLEKEAGETPNAPFKKSWPMLAMKKMVRYAAENGFDTIGWTQGAEQASRYDLSKQVDSIDVSPDDKSFNKVIINISGSRSPLIMGVEKDGTIKRASAEAESYRGKNLSDVIGKDLAAKILEEQGFMTLSGNDLKIGGEGQKGFYDKILPAEVKKFFGKKAWGNARVGEIEVDSKWFILNDGLAALGPFNSKKEATEQLKKSKKHSPDYNLTISRDKGYDLHALEITPQMKRKALYEGMPLFQTAGQKINPDIRYQTKVFDKDEASFYQKSFDMVKGNIKYWKDKGKNYDEDVSAMAHVFKTTMYNAEKIGGAFKRFWDVVKRQDDIKYEAQNNLWYEGDKSLLNEFKDYSKFNKKEYAKVKDYLIHRDIDRKGFLVKNENNGMFNLYHWKKVNGERKLIGAYQTEEQAWQDGIQIEARESGFSEKGQEALINFRKMSHNLYHHFASNIEETIRAYEKAGRPIPQITIQTESGDTQIDLRAASDRMGDLRGSYFPRLRNPGKWRVIGEKKGASNEMQFFDTKVGANSYRAKLERAGYKTQLEKTGQFSEDLFQSLEPLLAQQQILNRALKDISNKDKQRILEDANIKGVWRGDTFVLSGQITPDLEALVQHLGGKYKENWSNNTYKPEIAFEHITESPYEFEDKVTKTILHSGGLDVDMDLAFANAMVKQYDTILKSHGARSRMISRSDATGLNVVQGYEKDPLTAITSALQAAAGSHAKAVIARDGAAAIAGREISWQDYKKENMGAISTLESELEELSLNTPEEKARKKVLDGQLRDIRLKLQNEQSVNPEYIIRNQRKIKKILDEMKSLVRWSDIDKAMEIKKKISAARQGMYEDYLKLVDDRKINAKTQARAYSEATEALKDILRNQEFADRVLGTIKGLSVWQYLGFRVSSAAINVTNMALGVPAAMNGETDNKVSITKSIKNIGKAMKNFTLHRGGKLTGEWKDVFDMIKKQGWDSPVFNNEAFDILSSRLGKGWQLALEKSMWMFSKTEEFNRATSIAATYFAMKEAGMSMSQEELLNKAKDISDKAHGVYSKANRPYHMRGGNLAGRVLQASYVFHTFEHNYMQEMYRLGFDKKQWKAAAYMAFAPAIFGIGATVPMGIAKAISSALGGDDPEEKLIQLAEDSFGMGDITRNGIMGVSDHGVNLRGSLATRFGVPDTFMDIFGAPGSVVGDIWDGGKNITKGFYREGFEKIAPAGIGNISKGLRESTQGVTTKSGTPIYWGKDRLKADTLDVILRLMSFNPTGISKKKEIQWNEYEIQNKYKKHKTELYKRLKRFYSSPDRQRSDILKINTDIRDFNTEIKEKGISRIVKPITAKSKKAALRVLANAPKRERERFNK